MINNSNISFIFHNGKMKISQYGFLNSCPKFAGIDSLNLLRKILPINSEKYDMFIHQLNKCKFLNTIDFFICQKMRKKNNTFIIQKMER